MRARRIAIACGACSALLLVAGCGHGAVSRGRAATAQRSRSALEAATVGRLNVRWRFRIPGPDTFSGVDTAAPVVDGETVYLQDMDSDVFALDRETGHVLWRTRFHRRSPGPNGVVVAGGRVYGNTDRSTFALDAATGALVWVRRLTTPAQPIDVAPVVAGGLVYTSTVGLPPGGKGAIVALDAATGAVRWRFSTIRGRWAVPREAGGGGLWWPLVGRRPGASTQATRTRIRGAGRACIRTAARTAATRSTPTRCSCSTERPAASRGTTR